MHDPTTLNALAEEANAITEASSLGLTSQRLARLCRSIARLCRSIVSRMSIIDSRAAEMEAGLRAANDSIRYAGQRIHEVDSRVEASEECEIGERVEALEASSGTADVNIHFNGRWIKELEGRVDALESGLRAANKKAGQRIDQLGERVEAYDADMNEVKARLDSMEDGWDIDGEGDGKFRTILLLGDDQRLTLSFNRPKERDEFSQAAAAFFRQWREARDIDTSDPTR